MSIYRFFIYFILFTIFLAIAPLVFQFFYPEMKFLIPKFWALFWIFEILTLSIYLLASWRMRISDKASGQALLGSVTIKLLFCMIIAFVYINANPVDPFKFIINFFIYISFIQCLKYIVCYVTCATKNLSKFLIINGFEPYFQFKKFFSIAICAVLFSFLSFSAFSQEHASSDTTHAASAEAHDSKPEKEEDISKVILHHIADSHEWHFFGHVALPLPVILWTDNGLVSFLSNKFGHNDHGTELLDVNGTKLVYYHGKYYYPESVKSADGTYIAYNNKGEIMNTKPLDISITKNVVSLLISVTILLVVFIGIANAYKKREGKAPKGLQSILEPIIIFVRDDIAKPQLGHKYRGFMPYLLTVFFFVWLNNLMGLIPFFPGGANLTGNIAVTMMLALCTFILTTVNGNKNYWGHVFTPHVPWWLYPLMIPVEIIGLFTKPIALMIRLFANITAGHILILSLISLIFILKSVLVAGIAVPFVLFISVIELVVGFIQAFIFTILSALFIGMAVEEKHAEH